MTGPAADMDAIPSLCDHPTAIHFGAGIANRLAASLPVGSRILAVASDGTRQRAATLFSSLADRGQLHFAEAVPAETTLDAISALVDRQRGRPCDVVLAVGGGAAMDAAKAVAIGIRTQAPFSAILDEPGRYIDTVLPLICVPTTAGSGSDVTPYSTIWDVAAARKRSLSHAALLPRESWIDPRLMTSLPATTTASSGLDALSHAVEAIWCRHHTPQTDRLSVEAIRLVAANLAIAVTHPGDLPARTAMARAALAAGLAISRSQSAAAHAASYPMTLHHGIAHGHACALSLAWLLRHSARTAPERAALIAEGFEAADPLTAAATIEALIRQVGLPLRLRDLGVPRAGLSTMVEATLASDRVRNTIGGLTPDQVDELFVTIW